MRLGARPRTLTDRCAGGQRTGGGADIELFRVEPSRLPAEPVTVSFDLPTDGDHAAACSSFADLACGLPPSLLGRPLEFDRLARVVDRLIAMCSSS
jgi:hypothetical protein